MILYVVYDNVGKTCILPLISRNFECLKRDITGLLYHNANFAQFAEDYSIIELGNIDDSANLTTCTPVVIAQVKEIMQSLPAFNAEAKPQQAPQASLSEPDQPLN